MIEGIGSWVRLHPSVFLTDQYLKYIAWALSDKARGRALRKDPGRCFASAPQHVWTGSHRRG